jgi:hypothetical protein
MNLAGLSVTHQRQHLEGNNNKRSLSRVLFFFSRSPFSASL